MFSRNRLICLSSLFCLVILSGCGSLTGIPGHGGGKRFAIEQELVAGCTRATIQQIDLAGIKGRKVSLFINTIGDNGSGNLVGGRFSVVSQLRGDYIQTPTVRERTSSSPYVSPIQLAESEKSSVQKGSGGEIKVGVEYKGLGSYHNSEEFSSDDLQYLSGLFETYLFLKGVHIVPPSEAEIDVYIIVDVFGTVRTRVDWFLANNEILRSKTAVEVMAVNHMTGELVMAPQYAVTEAEYNEQYILWAGPVSVKKYLKKTDPLLSDFTGLVDLEENVDEWEMQEGELDYPFKYEIGEWSKDDSVQ